MRLLEKYLKLWLALPMGTREYELTQD